MSDAELLAGLEALLFVAESPLTAQQLAAALQLDEAAVSEGLSQLQQRLDEGSGLKMVRIAGGFQICTRPEWAAAIGRLLKPNRARISRSLLETLAVIAYRQPVTLAEIDAFRGVGSEYAVAQLVDRDLVHEVGRKPVAGRPILYGTTRGFLHQFNLDSLEALPPLATQDTMEAAAEAMSIVLAKPAEPDG